MYNRCRDYHAFAFKFWFLLVNIIISGEKGIYAWRSHENIRKCWEPVAGDTSSLDIEQTWRRATSAVCLSYLMRHKAGWNEPVCFSHAWGYTFVALTISYAFSVGKRQTCWLHKISRASSTSKREIRENQRIFCGFMLMLKLPLSSSLSLSLYHVKYWSVNFLLFLNFQSINVDQRRESESFQFCRVVLPDHSSTIVLCKEGQTLRQALVNLCERRRLSFVAHDVFLGGGEKVAKNLHDFYFYWAQEIFQQINCLGSKCHK